MPAGQRPRSRVAPIESRVRRNRQYRRPGLIKTPASSEQEIAAGRGTPLGRSGRRQEVAAAVAFLASEASYIFRTFPRG